MYSYQGSETASRVSCECKSSVLSYATRQGASRNAGSITGRFTVNRDWYEYDATWRELAHGVLWNASVLWQGHTVLQPSGLCCVSSTERAQDIVRESVEAAITRGRQ